MPYTPNNSQVYIAAYQAALNGMTTAGKVITDSTITDYADSAAIAGAFAQEFDTVWGTTVTSLLALEMIRGGCYGMWSQRSSHSNDAMLAPSTYSAEVNALIATINEALAYFAANGIPTNYSPASAAVLAQAAWYIDPQNTTGLANDANKGDTALVPMKTWQAVLSRIGSGSIVKNNTQKLDIFFLSNMNPTDPFICDSFTIGQDMNVTVHGPTTLVRNGTISAVQQIDSTTAATGGSPLIVTDAAFGGNWTANQLVTITSGPRTGDRFFVAFNLGAGAAEMSACLTPFVNFGATSVNPQVGDTYKVETLGTMYIAPFKVRTEGRTVALAAGITNFIITTAQIAQSGNNPLSIQDDPGVMPLVFDACILSNIVRSDPGFIQICNSVVTLGTVGLFGELLSFIGGVLNSAVCIIREGSGIILDQDTYVKGAGITIGSGGVMACGSVGFFRCTSDCITVGPGAILQIGELSSFQFNEYALYGNGNASFGVNVQAGGRFFYESTLPILKAATGDFKMATNVVAQYYDTASGTFQPAAGIACTWANMAVAQPAGFGGSAFIPGRDVAFTFQTKHT